MSIGPIRKELIAVLKELELEEGAVVGILLMLDTEEKADEMIEWILDNVETLDRQHILMQAAKLSGKIGLDEENSKS